MWISCWSCGEDVWLETQKQCRHCDAPTHRCADCEHYDAVGPRCTALNIEVDPDDAERPTRLALSFNWSRMANSWYAMALLIWARARIR